MRTYGQYCGLAKALDHVGDRWTLLIVRELLLGVRRYSQIREALPGIASNLLAQRLRDLTSDGVIRRIEPSGAYELTEFGRELEPIVLGLVRWGGRWMGEREPNDVLRAEWLAVALAALLPRRRRGKIEVRAGDATIGIAGAGVRPGAVDEPDAVIEGTAEAVLGVAAGALPLSALSVRGDRAVVERMLARGG